MLFITNGLSGGLNGNYELARRLTRAGHEIGFFGYGDLGERINGQGYSYTRVQGADDAMSTLRAQIDRIGRVRSVPAGASLRRDLISSREIETAVAAEKPDGLIIDLEAHYCVLATRSLGIPTVLKNDFFSLAYQRGTPPLHSELAHPHDWKTRRAADFEWMKAQAEHAALQTVGELRPAQLMRRWAPFRYNTVSRRDLRAVARDRSLSLREITSQRQWIRPHTYPGLPMVTATARELDFVTTTSPNNDWVGPLVFRDRTDVAMSATDRTRWHQFRDRNEQSGRPLLYCTFGTMWPDTTAMLSNVISAARSRPLYDLVVGLGGRDETHFAHADDANILTLDYAPQLEVLAAANAAIVHGGINTINECLTLGVPIIVERTGPFDGPGNASRVEHHRVGVRANLATIDSSRLAETIDAVLTDTALQERVTAMQAHFHRYETNQIAEQTVERMLANQRSQPT